MQEFKNKEEKKFWVDRLKFAEKDQLKSPAPKTNQFIFNAIEYADKALEEFRNRTGD